MTRNAIADGGRHGSPSYRSSCRSVRDIDVLAYRPTDRLESAVARSVQRETRRRKSRDGATPLVGLSRSRAS